MKCSPAVTRAELKLSRSNYRIYDCKSQGVELYFSASGFVKGLPKSDREIARTKAGCSDNREANQERACRRARGIMRRVCKTHDLGYMWTFTCSEVEGLDFRVLGDAWKAFSSFVRTLRRYYPGIKFVVVPELQDRGVWHFHFVTDTYLDWDWVSYQWGCGFVLVSHDTKDVRGACTYIAKYISKTFADSPLGQHRYKRSRNMPVDIWEGDAEDLEQAFDIASAESGYPLVPDFIFCDGGQHFVIASVGAGRGELLDTLEGCNSKRRKQGRR